MLQEELLMVLSEAWPCRESQVKQLSSVLSPRLPSPSTLVVHGPEATGKSGVVKAYLETSALPHAIVSCKECVTGRHLLERTLAATIKAAGATTDRTYTRCENMSSFANALQKTLEGSGKEKFVLVIDGIDEQREAPPTLVPALARLGNLIPSLTLILILTHPPPRFHHLSAVPHIYFPPYTRSQSLQILTSTPAPPIFPTPPTPSSPSSAYPPDLAAEDNAWVWTRFCAAVWDSLAKPAARDLVGFRRTCRRLWRPFVAPIVEGTFGTRDFSRLVVAQRRLFQEEGSLVDSVVAVSTASPSAATETAAAAAAAAAAQRPQTHDHDLPYLTKHLLLAAYLASHNPARTDTTFFTKSSERKRRKKGGGTALTRTRHSATATRKIPRHLLAPAPFPLDRWFAIFAAIVPHEVSPNADLYAQVATLASLRLVVRSGVLAAGGDGLEPGAKWKCGVGWEYVVRLGRGVGVDLGDYVAE